MECAGLLTSRYHFDLRRSRPQAMSVDNDKCATMITQSTEVIRVYGRPT